MLLSWLLNWKQWWSKGYGEDILDVRNRVYGPGAGPGIDGSDAGGEDTPKVQKTPPKVTSYRIQEKSKAAAKSFIAKNDNARLILYRVSIGC